MRISRYLCLFLAALWVGCHHEELCDEVGDEDKNGLADCADPVCIGAPACVAAEICDNAIDDDGDGRTDCADTDCIGDPICPAAICGNGALEAGEACDDGNGVNTDACLNSCALASCGDGFVQSGVESCEPPGQGNCNAQCQLSCQNNTDCQDADACTTNERCDLTNNTCKSDAVSADDNNACTIDACDPVAGVSNTPLSIDDNNTCTADSCDPSTGVAHAGLADGTACDVDNNPNTRDICRATACAASSCGDGFVDTGASEQCDGANVNNQSCVGLGFASGNLACSNACQLDTSTCVASALCGNGTIDAGEQCDDGAQNSNTGACLTSCRSASCGDGFVQAGVEQCDDQNQSNTDSCLNTCQSATCGDSFIQLGVEQCEPPNNTTCDQTCHTIPEVGHCADGVDNDGDGQVDCQDADCASDASCLPGVLLVAGANLTLQDVSADGLFIAYSDPTGKLFFISTSGGNPTQVSIQGALTNIDKARFKGKLLVVLHIDPANPTKIALQMEVFPQGSATRAITSTNVRIKDIQGSADGNHLYYARNGNQDPLSGAQLKDSFLDKALLASDLDAERGRFSSTNNFLVLASDTLVNGLCDIDLQTTCTSDADCVGAGGGLCDSLCEDLQTTCTINADCAGIGNGTCTAPSLLTPVRSFPINGTALITTAPAPTTLVPNLAANRFEITPDGLSVIVGANENGAVVDLRKVSINTACAANPCGTLLVSQAGDNGFNVTEDSSALVFLFPSGAAFDLKKITLNGAGLTTLVSNVSVPNINDIKDVSSGGVLYETKNPNTKAVTLRSVELGGTSEGSLATDSGDFCADGLTACTVDADCAGIGNGLCNGTGIVDEGFAAGNIFCGIRDLAKTVIGFDGLPTKAGKLDIVKLAGHVITNFGSSVTKSSFADSSRVVFLDTTGKLQIGDLATHVIQLFSAGVGQFNLIPDSLGALTANNVAFSLRSGTSAGIYVAPL